MLLLLCIMSETDSDLGDFSCQSLVTGNDDNVSGFSECEIRDVGVSSVTPARLRVYRLANTHSLHSVSGLTDWRTRTRCTQSPA